MKHRLLAALLLLLTTPAMGSDPLTINLDAADTGRVFEGIGAVSAGASSRLLIDYPEPQRSEILDYLFKPDFGAGIQHLKVEVGGDVNSTDGSEPSHMHSRDDLNFQRGYEWWLMEEAKKRNPKIILDCLPWGAPGWIGHGKFCSQDMADYLVKFIQGAKSSHGLDISYVGLWNERDTDPGYAGLLRKTLDENALQSVGIVAWDLGDWNSAKRFKDNSTPSTAIAVVSAHYPHFNSTPDVQACGKPIWSSEDGPWDGTWAATGSSGASLAQTFNRNYIQGRMTATEIWSPITSYYDNLPLPGSGLMRANTPWSGHYEVQPALWNMAHTTQCAQPGWKYMDAACVLIPNGSVVALRSPDNHDYSLVIETMAATQPQTLTFHIANDLPTGALHVWHSSAKEQFVQTGTVAPLNGTFTFTAEPGSLYSLTTTTGQRKGTTAIPASMPFPATYTEDFEHVAPNASPRYFSDQWGAFEVAPRDDDRGHELRLATPQPGIVWIKMREPFTVLGDSHWKDGTVSVDVRIKNSGYVALYGRIGDIDMGDGPLNADRLSLKSDGSWDLSASGKILVSGRINLSAGSWHNLKLRFAGDEITALLDGADVGNARDPGHASGMVGVGSGWNEAEFDNLSIQMVPTPQNLALGAQATASSQWSDAYSADKAVDGSDESRWNAADGETAGEWLAVEFARPTRLNHVVLLEFEHRINKYRVQARSNGGDWHDLYSGTAITPEGVDLPSTTADQVRVLVDATNGETPSLAEFKIYDQPAAATPK